LAGGKKGAILMRTERIIQQHLDQASKQWKWLRFLRHSATLGIIVTFVLLLLGVVVACGWLTSGGVVTVCLVLLVVGAVLALALLGLVVATSEPEQDKLARAIERAHPTLMDRLNTLVFLDRLRETPSVRSYYRRIEGQVHSAFAGRTLGSPFSSARAVARLCALAALIIVTLWFYLQFTPLAAFTATGTQLHGGKPQLEKPFEIPTAEPEPELAKETTPWGEVRIIKPGRDLTVTRVEDIPLQIEASASEPVKSVEWNNARRQAAGTAKAGLQKVSQAFTVSQPQLLAELQQDDAFQPGGQRSLDRGIEHLESLLQSSQDGRRLSAEDRKKLQQEALTDIEKGIENLGSDTESSKKTYRALREFYTPSVTVDPKVIQRLIEQLENLSVELVEVPSEEPGEPEIRHIDPEKLPQAYRERIRKYFEKLSEQ
jgi:hypothetical protein